MPSFWRCFLCAELRVLGPAADATVQWLSAFHRRDITSQVSLSRTHNPSFDVPYTDTMKPHWQHGLSLGVLALNDFLQQLLQKTVADALYHRYTERGGTQEGCRAHWEVWHAARDRYFKRNSDGVDMCSEQRESWQNTILQSKVGGKGSQRRHSGWMMWRKGRLWLNDMWRKPKDRVAWRKHVSRVASMAFNRPLSRKRHCCACNR